MELDKNSKYTIELTNTNVELFDARLRDYWVYKFLDLGMNQVGQNTYGVYEWNDKVEPGNLQAMVMASHYQLNQLRLTIYLWKDDDKFSAWFDDWLQKNYRTSFLQSPEKSKQSFTYSEPERWPELLSAEGLERGSDKWWDRIEELVRRYWKRHGRRSLPIQGRLTQITAYSRKQIYEKTNLGNKEET